MGPKINKLDGPPRTYLNPKPNCNGWVRFIIIIIIFTMLAFGQDENGQGK